MKKSNSLLCSLSTYSSARLNSSQQRTKQRKKTNTALLDNSLLPQPVPGQGQERGQGFLQEEAVNLAQPYSAALERATSNTCMSDDS